MGEPGLLRDDEPPHPSGPRLHAPRYADLAARRRREPDIRPAASRAAQSDRPDPADRAGAQLSVHRSTRSSASFPTPIQRPSRQIPAMAFAPDSQYPPSAPWSVMMIQSASIRRSRASSTGWPSHIPKSSRSSTCSSHAFATGLLRERLLAMLAGFFGASAAVLAVVGLYGMISFAVARAGRRLGSASRSARERPQVVGMMMREAGWLLGAGVAVGAGLSLLAGRSTASAALRAETQRPAHAGRRVCCWPASPRSRASFRRVRRRGWIRWSRCATSRKKGRRKKEEERRKSACGSSDPSTWLRVVLSLSKDAARSRRASASGGGAPRALRKEEVRAVERPPRSRPCPTPPRRQPR